MSHQCRREKGEIEVRREGLREKEILGRTRLRIDRGN